MIKLDSSSLPLTMSIASLSGPGPAHRLIVLIPDVETDYTSAVHRVWELADALGSRVLFLGLCKDAADEPRFRRQLITMSAMLEDGKLYAEARVEIGSNWVNAVKSDLQDGDLIVCPAEQREGVFQRPLSQILESNLGAPVYILSGLSTRQRPRADWLSQAAAWAGSASIIAGAAMLQIRIVSLPKDWAQTALLILSVIAEAWLIWVWNDLFG